MSITIKSITGQIHDMSFGGYPYKIVVRVELPVKEFNKMCPQVGKSRTTMFGRRPAARDLGNLVLEVNNMVYDIDPNIPAHNPSIDSQGPKRAVKGIKSMEFVYFLRDHDKAEALGFEVRRFKNGECKAKYGQYVLHPQCKGETGVVNRLDGDMVSVFRTKHGGFATWFFKRDLKVIGGKGKGGAE